MPRRRRWRAERGPFRGFGPPRARRCARWGNHARAANGEASGFEALSIAPVPLDHTALSKTSDISDVSNLPHRALGEHARAVWARAVTLGQRHGFRNAQVSVIAPTGTIGLVMDCDTTGIEPDFALVKFKKLAGGGY